MTWVSRCGLTLWIVMVWSMANAIAASPAPAQDGQGTSSDFGAGYAQAVLERDFKTLALKAQNGDRAGHVVVVSSGCLNEAQQLAISKALLGRTIDKVSWEMSCPSEAVIPPPVTTPAAAQKEQKKVELLPRTLLFTPLLADPREPRFSISYQDHRGQTSGFKAGDVTLGQYQGLAGGVVKDDKWQFGIEGAVFALFNLDATSNDLINADYFVGVPYTWRRHAWSLRARLYHQSSHLGDEFLLGNPGVDRINLSYEAFDLIVSHEWTRLRFYGGGGTLLHSEPDLHRGLAQLGAEYKLGTVLRDIDLTLGADFKSTEEQGWNVNQSYRAGFSFNRSSRQIMLLLQRYVGHSPNGQFFSERLSYTGLGFYFAL